MALRTSIIVGFPGETDDDFRQTLEFLDEARFDRLVAFPYFPEDGTAAFKLDDRVPDDVQQRRVATLLEFQSRISREKNRSMVGQTLDVLIDRPGTDREAAIGRSHREAPEIDGVIRVTGKSSAPGQFTRVRITGANAFDLTGVAVPDRTRNPREGAPIAASK